MRFVKYIETNLKGCFLIEPTVFGDKRGTFFEFYHKRKFEEAIGKQVNFVQDNHSISHQGVLRGLHFQTGRQAQAKLVGVVEREVLDEAFDLREDSKTFG